MVREYNSRTEIKTPVIKLKLKIVSLNMYVKVLSF